MSKSALKPDLKLSAATAVPEAASLATLNLMAILMAVTGSLLALYIFFYSITPRNFVAPAMIGVLGVISRGLLRQGRVRLVAQLFVSGVLVTAVASVITFGSLRSPGVMLFIAAVVAAGIFLGRLELLISMAFTLFALSGLLWAEQQGLLITPSMKVDLRTLISYLTIIFVIAIMVFYARERVQQAHERLLNAFEARRRIEQERDRSMERFARIFDSSPSAMMTQSAKSGLILEVNPAFERCFGYDNSQLQGHPDHFLWVDTAERTRYLKSLVSRSRFTQDTVTALRADGSEFNALISSDTSVDLDDRLVITTITDISAEKRRQSQLLSLASGLAVQSGEAMFEPIAMHMAQTINANMVCVSELLNATEARTLSVWKNQSAETNFTFALASMPCFGAMAAFEPCVETLGADGQELVHRLLDDGGYQTGVGLALRDASGIPMGILIACWKQPIELTGETNALINIFANRATVELLRLRSDRALEQLNQTLEQRVAERTVELQELNAELDSFAYSISHDLKSPLRAIDGFTQLLSERLKDRIDVEEQRLMDRVLGATHRTATLMADLLALTRVSQLPLRPERINLSLMAEEELEQCLVKYPRPNLTSRIELGLVTHADATLTRLMLKNLIENGVKYTRDQAEPLIEVGRVPNADSTQCSATPTFFVRDNGAGFSMEHADRLFKSFERLHMPSAGFEGNGIGLATVRRIVERHGGTILAKATVGKGAEFQFQLGGATASSGPARPG